MNNRTLGSIHKFHLKQTWSVNTVRDPSPGIPKKDHHPDITEAQSERGEVGQKIVQVELLCKRPRGLKRSLLTREM